MLIAIDLQNDTFAESGSSYNERANRIKHRITGRINKAVAENESIIYTKNLYPDFEHRNRTTDSIRFDEGIHTVFSDLLYKYGDERSEEHTSELQSRGHLVCRLLLEKKKHNSN